MRGRARVGAREPGGAAPGAGVVVRGGPERRDRRWAAGRGQAGRRPLRPRPGRVRSRRPVGVPAAPRLPSAPSACARAAFPLRAVVPSPASLGVPAAPGLPLREGAAGVAGVGGAGEGAGQAATVGGSAAGAEAAGGLPEPRFPGEPRRSLPCASSGPGGLLPVPVEGGEPPAPRPGRASACASSEAEAAGASGGRVGRRRARPWGGGACGEQVRCSGGGAGRSEARGPEDRVGAAALARAAAVDSVRGSPQCCLRGSHGTARRAERTDWPHFVPSAREAWPWPNGAPGRPECGLRGARLCRPPAPGRPAPAGAGTRTAPVPPVAVVLRCGRKSGGENRCDVQGGGAGAACQARRS